ncbi:MAG: NUDIX hydrolase [Candidatus Cloacimonadota bacterium]|nr:MAG: NUDIX hydrolase [Candidatus Cloacimonadota bacterium]
MIRLTVDCIIDIDGKVVLIKRKNPPFGWALPGGFVDEGETVEDAVRREVREETNLSLENLKQFHIYSDHRRDPRGHTVSVVFTANGIGELKAQDDAKEIGLFRENTLPDEIAFDHKKILDDYFQKIE